MKAKIVTLDNKAAGEIELNDEIFGIEPRTDILQRVVEWQRAKARAGTHKVKERNEVSGRKGKPFKQKGTGRARQGTERAPHHEGGGVAHGPRVRSHAYSLPKKIRTMGLKMALSTKQKAGQLVIVDSVEVKEAKTQAVSKQFTGLNLTKPLIITGAEVNVPFARAARNLIGVDVLPMQGANVYDILRHKELVITKDAIEGLQARLA